MPLNKKSKSSSEDSEESVKVEQFKFGRANKKKSKKPGPKVKYPGYTLLKKSVRIRESILTAKPKDMSYSDYVNEGIASSMNKPEKLMPGKNLDTNSIT